MLVSEEGLDTTQHPRVSMAAPRSCLPVSTEERGFRSLAWRRPAECPAEGNPIISAIAQEADRCHRESAMSRKASAFLTVCSSAASFLVLLAVAPSSEHLVMSGLRPCPVLCPWSSRCPILGGAEELLS